MESYDFSGKLGVLSFSSKRLFLTIQVYDLKTSVTDRYCDAGARRISVQTAFPELVKSRRTTDQCNLHAGCCGG